MQRHQLQLIGLAPLVVMALFGCDGHSPPAPGGGSSPARAEGRRPEERPDVRFASLGGLRARVWGGEDGRGGGAGPVVVMFHGYGAPGDDLVGLARRLEVGPNVRFVVPEAPLELGHGSRAWWALDPDRLRGGRDRDLSGEVPAGMVSARRVGLALVSALERELAAPPSRVVLVGFSQGAMLALDVALHMDEPLAGVAALSGTLVAERDWVARMEAKQNVPVLLSHGRQDPVLPFERAEELRDHLRSAGVSVRWVQFEGGHAIAAEVVEALGEFLRAELASPGSPATRSERGQSPG